MGNNEAVVGGAEDTAEAKMSINVNVVLGLESGGNWKNDGGINR